MGFGDRLATAHHLPLRDRIDGVDVVEAAPRLGVALMHRVDPQEAGLAARVGKRWRRAGAAGFAAPLWR